MATGLKGLLEAAACLCRQRDAKLSPSLRDKPEQELLKARLQNRIAAYRARLGLEADVGKEDVERATGASAFEALVAIHDAAKTPGEEGTDGEGASSSTGPAPLFGSRDLQTLRTLLSIVTQWYFSPLLASYDECLASLASPTGEVPEDGRATSRLQELPDEAKLREIRLEQRATLEETTGQMNKTASSLQNMLLGRAASEQGQKEVANAVINTCASHILAIAIRIGWGARFKPVAGGQPEGNDYREQARSLVIDLLKALSTLSALRVLSGVTKLSYQRPARLPGFVKATTSRLVAAQLLRPDAVMALLRQTFGADFDEVENGSNVLARMDGVAKLLSTPPAGMSAETFMSIIIPQLLETVSELPFSNTDTGTTQGPSGQSTPTQKKTATFVLARLAETHSESIKSCLAKHLWSALVPTSAKAEAVVDEGQVISQPWCISRAVDLLHRILQYAEPSSTFISCMVSPVVVPLFSLVSYTKSTHRHPAAAISMMDKGKAVSPDPSKELGKAATDILRTWLRLAEADEALSLVGTGLDGIFAVAGRNTASIVSGCVARGNGVEEMVPCWTEMAEGIAIKWARSSSEGVADAFADLSMDNPLRSMLEDDDNNDEDTAKLAQQLNSMLQLQPDPKLLADLLQASGRQDVAATLLVSLLDRYTSSKQQAESSSSSESLKTILHLQHLVQIIDVFGSQLIKGAPDKILAFVNFTLDAAAMSPVASDPAAHPSSLSSSTPKIENEADDMPFINVRPQNSQGGLQGLLNVEQEDRAEQNGADDKGTEKSAVEDEELVDVALSLLLSLLEGQPTMSRESTPLLKVVDAKLQSYMASSSQGQIGALAREVRLVLTARTSAGEQQHQQRDSKLFIGPREEALARGRDVYQEALKLLQDPILPVRAHGLVLLTKLVSARSTLDVAAMGHTDVLFDEALSPAILDIFLQAIQDDDSFLYLNAVKGLAEMAKRGGKPTLKRLLGLYVSDASAAATRPAMSQLEADRRLRVGEALLQVIKHLDEAMSAHVADVVPPLMAALRNRYLPATVRSSVVSLLGTCVEAAPTAMASQGYSHTLAGAMLDLASIESVERPSSIGDKSKKPPADEEEEGIIDAREKERRRKFAPGHDDAVDVDAKLPQLRRSALLLLALLIRGTRHQLEATQGREDDSIGLGRESHLEALRLPGNGAGILGHRQAPSDELHLFPSRLLARAKAVCGFLKWRDTDALVRHQAQDCVEELDGLELDLVHQAPSSLVSSPTRRT